MAMTICCYRSQNTKMSLAILQRECESKMMYYLNKEVYTLIRKTKNYRTYNTNNRISHIIFTFIGVYLNMFLCSVPREF